MKSLENQLCELIKDLLYSEQQIHRILPKMANRTDDQRLKSLVEKYLMSNEKHIDSLKSICKSIKLETEGKICSDIKFLIEEIENTLIKTEDLNQINSSLYNKAQRLLQLEISIYNRAIRVAENLEWDDIASKLQKSLDEKHSQEIEFFIST